MCLAKCHFLIWLGYMQPSAKSSQMATTLAFPTPRSWGAGKGHCRNDLRQFCSHDPYVFLYKKTSAIVSIKKGKTEQNRNYHGSNQNRTHVKTKGNKFKQVFRSDLKRAVGEGRGSSQFWIMKEMEKRPQTLHRSLKLVKYDHIMNFSLFYHA